MSRGKNNPLVTKSPRLAGFKATQGLIGTSVYQRRLINDLLTMIETKFRPHQWGILVALMESIQYYGPVQLVNHLKTAERDPKTNLEYGFYHQIDHIYDALTPLFKSPDDLSSDDEAQLQTIFEILEINLTNHWILIEPALRERMALKNRSFREFNKSQKTWRKTLLPEDVYQSKLKTNLDN